MMAQVLAGGDKTHKGCVHPPCYSSVVLQKAVTLCERMSLTKKDRQQSYNVKVGKERCSGGVCVRIFEKPHCR